MRVHVLQHVPFEGLGSIASWLEARHAEVSFTRFYESSVLPDPRSLELIVALGGPMSVNDERELPWLIDEKQFVAEAVRHGRAVLGICLGAQLLASCQGARVYPGPRKEIGWFPIQAEPHGPEAFALPPSAEVFHWHGETFDLPAGAILLASSPVCRHQAFQIGRRAIALQFHLETTPASAASIVAHCRHELVPDRYVQSEEEISVAPASAYERINALMAQVLEYLTRPGD